MPTLHTVTSTAWVAVTSATAGSLLVQEGNSTGRVAFAQSSSLPTTEIDDTPLLKKLKEDESMVYFNVPAGSLVYARSNADTWKISDSPTGE